MKQNSLIKNAIYNSIYTGLNLLFPLITAPYVSRVLGASNLGKVNFATVIVNWFILFAVFGTTTYGVREVAKARGNQEKLNNIFSEIVIINGTLSMLVALIYFVAVFNIGKFHNELPLYLIMSLIIILNMFAIDWFFQGLEKYRYITIRNAVVKSVSLICIFLFVKQTEHYVIYGLISVIATSLNGILNYMYSRNHVYFKLKNINPFKHFKNLVVFFLHTFIVNIYTNLDQVLLGFLIDTKSVAFMNRTKVITTVAISVATAISNVTLPRASYYNENDKNKFKTLMSKVPNFILWITIPITVGTICLAPSIMYALGGTEFLEAEILLRLIALTIILAPLSSYLQYQVLVASGEEKLGLYCAIITSVLSLILNIILIPKLGFLGAGIVYLLAEFSAVSMRYYIVKSKLGYNEIKFINRSTLTYFLAAVIMGITVGTLEYVIANSLISLGLGIIIGAVVYITVLLIMKEKVTFFLMDKIKGRFMR